MSRDAIPPELPDVFTASLAPVEGAIPLEAFAPRHARSGHDPVRRPRRRSVSSGGLGTLRPGTIVDKYRIEELLGVGGFAAVYRATHLLLHSTVALKLLRPDIVARRPGLATQLLQEARFAARIEHPNVVRVLDVTHTAAITYIVMEFIRGPSLARVLADHGRLPEENVARIGLDTIEGLQAGLAQGLIHRDIKPPNILLSDTGVARIVDLGLANPIDDSDHGPLRDSTLIGTRGYMSPEQIAGPRAVDFRSDIYSLGVTMREAATGTPPSRTGALDAPAPSLSPAFARVMSWMVAPDREDRPRSYRELREALEPISNGASTQPADSGSERRIRNHEEKR